MKLSLHNFLQVNFDGSFHYFLYDYDSSGSAISRNFSMTWKCQTLATIRLVSILHIFDRTMYLGLVCQQKAMSVVNRFALFSGI
jgi:hypothetical protein